MTVPSELQTEATPPPGPLNDEITTRNKAYERAVAHEIKGLFSSFQAAVTVLRIAYSCGELDANVEKEKGSLDAFFERLNMIEQDLYQKHALKPFVVVVEGLDGTGKSTLVKTLAEDQRDPFIGRAVSTPTASMDAIRPVFDKRGGPVARAIYMVSNYVLQHEMRVECQRNPNTVFIVDRWYSSTCAYSIAWKNTMGGPESIDALDESLFKWPHDLDPPHLMLLLRVDNETRKERVSSRAKEASFNHWDERLSNDAKLGKRIMRCFERITGPGALVCLNANKSKVEVAQQGAEVVRNYASRFLQPWEYFKYQPLEFFRWVSSQLGLCDAETGRRCERASWTFQLATSTKDGDWPSLRTVDIHAADSSGILLFSFGEPTSGTGSNTCNYVSMACSLGVYPNEQQWRAEGILCPTTLEECDILDMKPPESLVAELTACYLEGKENQQKCNGQQGSHQEMVDRVRQSPLPRDEQSRIISPMRFVPIRMQVSIGGLRIACGPCRYEWRRQNIEKHNGWSEPKRIMPFTSPGATTFPMPSSSVMPITLAITGTHCAGKRTLGEQVARVLGWKFDAELGDILRDTKDIVVDAHKTGYGNGVGTTGDKMEWDDRLYFEECNRDRGSCESRVVETWHLGNLAWALLRDNGLKREIPKEKAKLTKMARSAVVSEQVKSCVLFVHLETSPETTIRRRKMPENSARVPMADEEAECASLHFDLQIRGQELLSEFEDLCIPVLVLDNNDDGDAAVEAAIRRIVHFVNLNLWRTCKL